jgi:AcrR family transcriptional regulator
MPRVSAAHLAARREQIIEAATRCFARNGFHATSMQDVIADAGMSVGAVYRYFKSKDELIRAIAERKVGRLGAELKKLAAHEPPLTVPEVMDRALDLVEPMLAQHGVASIALQVWAESLRDPALAEFVRGNYGQLRGGFVAAARRAREAGHLPPGTDPDTLGVALFSLLPGYVIQRVLTGEPSQATMRAGVHALLSTPIPVHPPG